MDLTEFEALINKVVDFENRANLAGELINLGKDFEKHIFDNPEAEEDSRIQYGYATERLRRSSKEMLGLFTEREIALLEELGIAQFYTVDVARQFEAMADVERLGFKNVSVVAEALGSSRIEHHAVLTELQRQLQWLRANAAKAPKTWRRYTLDEMRVELEETIRDAQARLAELEGGVSLQTAGLGHNNPPEGIDATVLDAAEVQSLKNELAAAAGTIARSSDADAMNGISSRIRAFGNRLRAWIQSLGKIGVTIIATETAKVIGKPYFEQLADALLKIAAKLSRYAAVVLEAFGGDD